MSFIKIQILRSGFRPKLIAKEDLVEFGKNSMKRPNIICKSYRNNQKVAFTI